MYFTLPLLLAAGSLPLISGAPVAYSHSRASAGVVQVDQATSSHSLSGRSSNLYAAVFGGSGLVSDGWPAISNWVSSFDDMFDANKEIMGSSCSQWGVPDTTEAEMATMKTAINKIAGESGVDARFILAIIMQESNGCVRVHTTNNGVVNPGLMQSHNGKGSCNTGISSPENVQNPCPESEIEQMIRDGTMGTTEGDGLQQLIEANGGTGDVTAYYKAARCYNSGSIASGGNLGAGIATHCYASDIANRLLGWASGTSSCNDGTISTLTGSNWSGSSSSGSSSSSSSPTTTSSANPTGVTTILPEPAAPTTTATSTTSSTVVPTTTPVAAIQTPAATAATPTSGAELYPYTISPCQEYYTIVEGDYCRKVEVQFGITAAQLQAWNTGLDDSCTNLWKGYQYCVKA
ncbi:uncharacterized protein N7473_013016 [Penicillium subrubescens]|uniref:LysM domain-containing protein n=1 Tax=Penicillium subrubescens TaxID=1316194 RepID=A0A1Q5T6X1_9EURO|nr:uncharacterized protein N7473_013016 [Penicillium subrubescens]KAJ5875669.1 hypothetical protein N7473_013016 [Penicillium subrubescens]OKO95974.1 hypothetical protein PENSUB_10995 [Penicillium subrubescens]